MRKGLGLGRIMGGQGRRGGKGIDMGREAEEIGGNQGEWGEWGSEEGANAMRRYAQTHHAPMGYTMQCTHTPRIALHHAPSRHAPQHAPMPCAMQRETPRVAPAVTHIPKVPSPSTDSSTKSSRACRHAVP